MPSQPEVRVGGEPKTQKSDVTKNKSTLKGATKNGTKRTEKVPFMEAKKTDIKTVDTMINNYCYLQKSTIVATPVKTE